MSSCYHVVLDTNVVISTMLKRHSVPGMIVDCCLEGVLIPVMDVRVLNEYQEVLSRPKFRFPQDIIEDFLAGLRERAVIVEAEAMDLDFADAADKKFYEIAVESRKTRETFLVTGNLRHFPQVQFVISPREMLDLIYSGLP